MFKKYIATFSDDSRVALRARVIAMIAVIAIANVFAWIYAVVALRSHPLLLGTAFLAYTFGLRHAVDADHIAAIDNTTRKLMQSGKRPVSAGFFFAVGHSTIVILLSVGVAFAASSIEGHFDQLKAVGGIIATSVSATFLLVLAIVNIQILYSVVQTFRRVKLGEALVEDDLDILMNKSGFLSRIFRPLFRLVTRSWHMFPIGFLFGLSFDTATEVALFGISASQAAKGMSVETILVFPTLFMAGMTLIDTADGLLMLGAYGWAFRRPARKLFYNITITFVSVVAAVLIGGIEVLALSAQQFQLKGAFWDFVGKISDNFGMVGYLVIGLFIVSWLVSVAVYKIGKYDELPINIS
ncbi:HoxN/HupN/NixA family nickel/cobalt transporter [Paraburkholderia tropica]|uniref:Nickel/cobalt efflux system n=2 Tax=Paraburkholderia tropica TaxID=92647 RepID=A0AAQ1GDD3_9BURK|nr:HoxN/HupN/NixA family nickel/cobalt transporter [Paraburkholderia tropica]SEJ33062.1 high-affinity nickel-transport protein [Paraburkholderia tropica]